MTSSNPDAWQRRHAYVVEHLDPELEQWSALEYQCIAEECAAADTDFVLSSISQELQLPRRFLEIPEARADCKSVEQIFAQRKHRVCLLDPAAPQELEPSDRDRFDAFVFGGILGDDPPRDRTSELRHKGFTGRRLGPVQMTTDTAVRVTRLVVEGQQRLDAIPYIDHPEIVINKHESTTMPFRYVVNKDGKPIMPEGMLELIKKDSEKSFGDLL